MIVTPIQGAGYGVYHVEMQDDPARPPAPGDCARYRLSEQNDAQPISSDPVRPGGTTRLRPLWSMRGQTYDVPFECLSNWRVSAAEHAQPDHRSITIAAVRVGRIQVPQRLKGVRIWASSTSTIDSPTAAADPLTLERFRAGWT